MSSCRILWFFFISTFDLFFFSTRERQNSGGRRSVLSAVSDESEEMGVAAAARPGLSSSSVSEKVRISVSDKISLTNLSVLRIHK
jgi:hypothetical protein